MNDRKLIGQLLSRMIDRNWPSWATVERESGVSRATLYRIKDADPRILPKTLRRIEGTLGLPYDTFVMVGEHDWDGLAEVGLDAELIAWLQRTAAPAPEEAPARPAKAVRGRTPRSNKRNAGSQVPVQERSDV